MTAGPVPEAPWQRLDPRMLLVHPITELVKFLPVLVGLLVAGGASGTGPWALLGVIGLVNPVMREVGKMRYLWQNPMRLSDPRLDAILGEDFGTPYQDAITATVTPLFADMRQAA